MEASLVLLRDVDGVSFVVITLPLLPVFAMKLHCGEFSPHRFLLTCERCVAVGVSWVRMTESCCHREHRAHRKSAVDVREDLWGEQLRLVAVVFTVADFTVAVV